LDEKLLLPTQTATDRSRCFCGTEAVASIPVSIGTGPAEITIASAEAPALHLPALALRFCTDH
jgi:hypothetical protein